MPSSWVDVNESPSEAACKEIFEESEFKARAVELMALFDIREQAHPPQLPHLYKMFFIYEIIGGGRKPSIETSEIAFFEKQICQIYR